MAGWGFTKRGGGGGRKEKGMGVKGGCHSTMKRIRRTREIGG